MPYLLDTNICIYLMKVHPPQVVARFEKTVKGDVFISVVTYAELRHGVESCPAQDRSIAERSLRRLVLREIGRAHV